MLAFSNHQNESINKRLADLALTNYRKGLAVKNLEEAPEDDVENDNIVTINPVDNSGKKGYSAKKKIASNKISLGKAKDALKEFMSQSNMLDTELNQMVSQFKLNNKNEFYGGSVSPTLAGGSLEGGALGDSADSDPFEFSDDEYIPSDHVNTKNALKQKIYELARNTDEAVLKTYMVYVYGKEASTNFNMFFNKQFPADTNSGHGLSEHELEAQITDMNDLYDGLSQFANYNENYEDLKADILNTLTKMNIKDLNQFTNKEFGTSESGKSLYEIEAFYAKEFPLINVDELTETNGNTQLEAMQKVYNNLSSMDAHIDHYKPIYRQAYKDLFKTVKATNVAILKQYMKTKYNFDLVSKAEFMKEYFETQFTMPTDVVKLTEEQAEKEIVAMAELYNGLLALGGITDANFESILKEQGIPINRSRSDKKGDQGHLLPATKEELMDSYLGKNTDKKDKNGVRVVNNIDIKNLSPEMLLTIKKLNNVIITLSPTAQNLAENRFSSATHNEVNKIKAMYEDMDQKMYILTSVSNIATQLTKLDEDFEVLYNSVIMGTGSHQPMTGGSLSISGKIGPNESISTYKPIKHKITQLYML